MSVRVGLKLRPEQYAIETQRQVWMLGDQAGFDHLWSYDHLVAVGAKAAAPIFEGWALMAAMAESTTRARLGLLVTGNAYRHPAHLAKIAVTVDHLSNGRLEMGIGAGWNEPEFTMLGLNYPSTPDRIGQLDEACAMLKLLWTQARTTFDGRYYHLTDAIAEPKPIQKPHPPLWIGGSGPKRTLRVVAKHADVWNPNGKTIEADLEASRLLDAHCEAVGRDPRTIRRSIQLFWSDAETICRQAEDYGRAGFSEVILVIHPDRLPHGTEPVRVAEMAAREALPRLRAIA
jgi:F420-dependent oxidoreductase-like protein